MDLKDLSGQLQLPPWFVAGLLNAGLLGFTDAGKGPEAEAVRHFMDYGTQWQDGLPPRSAPYDQIPEVAGWEGRPPATFSHMQIMTRPDMEAVDADVQWLAHFYFRPNPFFFPDPAASRLVGDVPIRLRQKLKLMSGKQEIFLYPDPQGRLALAAVTGAMQKGVDPMVEALDTVTPLLNHLSTQTDHALPIVQKLWFGLPSGAINIYTSARPEPVQLEVTDFVSHGQLADAESLYRMGLANNEPMYRFLSFWRVNEAVDQVQGQCRIQPSAAVRKGLVTRFPQHPVFGSLAGKKLNAAIDEYQGIYRNAIAHGGLAGGAPVLSGASAAGLHEMELAIPVMRFMARARIENMQLLLQSVKQ